MTGKLFNLALSALAAALLGLAGCARQPLPLDQDPALAGLDPFLGADLVLAGQALAGDPFVDRARLELIEGREGEPLPCGGGWLLQVRRTVDWTPAPGPESQALLVWLGAGAQRGRSRLVARADSLRLLALLGAVGPPESARLLLLERGREEARPWRQLVRRDLQGGGRCLARAAADRLDWREQPAALRLAEEREARPFREGVGSWHLEVERPLVSGLEDWELGPARPVESPYRALAEFLDAARRGRWRQAARRADLTRLLALPDGSWSPELKASLEAGLPELLTRRVQLSAPRRGPLTRFEDLSGRLVWRVELDPRTGEGGEPRWMLVRLERVLRP